MTACAGKTRRPRVIDVCPGCADLFASGSSEARMGLFDRIGEIESVFVVCATVEKEMAVH